MTERETEWEGAKATRGAGGVRKSGAVWSESVSAVNVIVLSVLVVVTVGLACSFLRMCAQSGTVVVTRIAGGFSACDRAHHVTLGEGTRATPGDRASNCR